MPASALFEDFSVIDEAPKSFTPLQPNPSVSQTDAPQAHQSFDDGYKEGWVDAQAAAKSEQDTIDADVATALQEAGFAYFEARQHVFNSMRPLLEAMVTQFIPTLVRDNLVPIIVEKVEALARQTEPPLCILCAPEVEQQLRDVVTANLKFPVEVRAESTLTNTQALLQMSEGEALIDLGKMVSDLETSVAEFYTLTVQKEVANG